MIVDKSIPTPKTNTEQTSKAPKGYNKLFEVDIGHDKGYSTKNTRFSIRKW